MLGAAVRVAQQVVGAKMTRAQANSAPKRAVTSFAVLIVAMFVSA